MKKTIWMAGALMCAIAMFGACSDDDDEFKGNGEGAGNGGSGVVVKEKKLVRVEEQSEGSSYKDITLFSYDAQGRLSKITETDEDGDYSYDYTVIYGTDKVTVVSEDNDETVYELNGDGYMEECVDEGSDYRYVCNYSYSGGYLSRADFTYYDLIDGEWVPDGEIEYSEFTTSGGNLKGSYYVYEYKEDGKTVREEEHGTFEASNVANNMNIDFIYNEYMGWEDEYLLCIAGKRYQNLPERLDSDGYTVDFEYTVDDEGYVRKARITEKEGDYEYVEIYTFIYEE